MRKAQIGMAFGENACAFCSYVIADDDSSASEFHSCIRKFYSVNWTDGITSTYLFTKTERCSTIQGEKCGYQIIKMNRISCFIELYNKS